MWSKLEYANNKFRLANLSRVIRERKASHDSGPFGQRNTHADHRIIAHHSTDLRIL